MRFNLSLLLCYLFSSNVNYFLKYLFLGSTFLFLNLTLFSQVNQNNQSLLSCLELEIEVLSSPYCQGSFNGGQLMVNVIDGSGSGDYSYEWLNDMGGFLPGGPQINSTSLNFLTVNQTNWVYVTDNISNCIDSISYTFLDYTCLEDTALLEIESPFDPNPVGYNEYSQCDIKLVNYGCELRFKPEFIISHESDSIEFGDLIIEYYNSQSTWVPISYSINNDGDAIGFWGGDIGETINCDYTMQRPVRVKFNQFNPKASTGTYNAILRLWSVDNNGNLIDLVSPNANISLILNDTICDDLSVNIQSVDATCANQNNGQIFLSSNGGLGPYEYSLSNSVYAEDSIFNNLSYGIYFASVKDVNNCQNSDTTFIGPNPILPDSVWFDSIYSESVNLYWHVDSLVDGYKFRYREIGGDWQVIASGIYSNGIPEMYTYKIITDLTPATNYELQVKAISLSGCEEGWSEETYFFSTSIEEYSVNINNNCLGLSSGQIEFAISSLNNYNFYWNGPDGFVSTDTSIFDLFQGNYNLQILNDENIIFDSTFVVETNQLPELSILSISHEDCQQLGSATFEVLNTNNSPFTFKLNDASINVNLDFQNQFSFIDLISNTYELVIEDNSFCKDTLDFLILNNEDIHIQVLDINDNLNCYSDSTGFIEIGVQNGTGPYNYNLIFNGDTIVTQNSNIFYNLTVGNYTVVVSDSLDCNQQLSFPIIADELIISDSLELHKDVTCNGFNDGEFMLQIESNNFSHQVRLVDNLDTIYPWHNHPYLFNNLSGGVYTVEVIPFENNDCSYFYELEIIEPEPFILDSISVNDFICSGDSTVTLEAFFNGGHPPYNFLFNNDSNIMSNQLYAGSYFLEISDFNNCSIDTNFIISNTDDLLISKIDSLTLNISCFGADDGQIGVEVFGGVPPYQYKILDGVFQESNIITNLTSGNHFIVVQDSIGCSDTLLIILSQPELNLFIDDYILSDTLGYCSLCNGDSSGFVDITLIGGSPPYDYFMVNNPDTFSSSIIYDLIGGQQYQFFAKDSKGCLTDTLNIECSSPEELQLEVNVNLFPSCCYSCDAEVELLPEGGGAPYLFSSEEGVYQSDSLITNLCANVYNFKVLDYFGCETTYSNFEIQKTCLKVDSFNYINSSQLALVHHDICHNDGTGKIYVSAINGSGNYSFSLDNGPFVNQNQIVFDSLISGAHMIIVKDESNCFDTLQFNVLETNPIIISELIIDTIFCGFPNLNTANNQSDLGSISVVASGGGGNTYLYSLDEIDSVIYQSSGYFSNLDSGYYSLNILDSNECVKEFDFYLPSYSSSFEYSISEITCPNFNDGIIQIDTIYGDFDTWFTLNGILSNGNIFTSLSADTYNLNLNYMIPNSNEEICSYSQTISLLEKDSLQFTVENNFITCNGLCDGEIYINQASGGTAPYSFICINTNDTSLFFGELCSDEYAIKMLDSNSCYIIKDVSLNEPNIIYPIIGYEEGQLFVIEPSDTNPSSGFAPFSYQWYNSNGAIIGANDSLYEPNASDYYFLSISDYYGCSGESSIFNVEVFNIPNLLYSEVNIYPNPVKDILNVSYSGQEQISWYLTDIRGRVLDSDINYDLWKIDTSKLYSGIYFLNIKNNNQELIYKIIKQ